MSLETTPRAHARGDNVTRGERDRLGRVYAGEMCPAFVSKSDFATQVISPEKTAVSYVPQLPARQAHAILTSVRFRPVPRSFRTFLTSSQFAGLLNCTVKRPPAQAKRSSGCSLFHAEGSRAPLNEYCVRLP
jgi:hypothetical protein